MPFVQRVVNPVYIARKPPQSSSAQSKDVTDGHEGPSRNGRPPGLVDNVPSGHTPVNDNELEAVTNRTLSNALRQLASLVLIANDIFMDLNKELRTITDRSATIKVRITALVEKVDSRDAKLVTVRKYKYYWGWIQEEKKDSRNLWSRDFTLYCCCLDHHGGQVVIGRRGMAALAIDREGNF